MCVLWGCSICPSAIYAARNTCITSTTVISKTARRLYCIVVEQLKSITYVDVCVY